MVDLSTLLDQFETPQRPVSPHGAAHWIWLFRTRASSHGLRHDRRLGRSVHDGSGQHFACFGGRVVRMSRILLQCLTLVVFLPFCTVSIAQAPAADKGCEALLAQKLSTDLNLDLQRFDQSTGEGWRALSERGCFGEAADLIRRYRDHAASAHPVLRWHQAQMEAMAGRTESAIATALSTLRQETDDAKSAFRWNPYVLGTVAFLRGDLQGLADQQAVLARSAASAPMNAPNAELLGRLQACFGKPYREAVSCGR